MNLLVADILHVISTFLHIMDQIKLCQCVSDLPVAGGDGESGHLFLGHLWRLTLKLNRDPTPHDGCQLCVFVPALALLPFFYSHDTPLLAACVWDCNVFSLDSVTAL